MTSDSVLARLDRLESLDAIRQLAAKYSLALDMRDLDALVNLFAEDIRIGRDKSDGPISNNGWTTRCGSSSRGRHTI